MTGKFFAMLQIQISHILKSTFVQCNDSFCPVTQGWSTLQVKFMSTGLIINKMSKDKQWIQINFIFIELSSTLHVFVNGKVVLIIKRQQLNYPWISNE